MFKSRLEKEISLKQLNKPQALEQTEGIIPETDEKPITKLADLESDMDLPQPIKQQILDQIEKIITDVLREDNQNQISIIRKRLEGDASLTTLLR